MNKIYSKNQQGLLFFASTILLLIMVLQPIQAQEKSQYTLQEVIRLAQDQSPDAQIARHRFKSSYWQYRNFK
ncbi:MAG: hypothetical protein COW63_14930, partial [Bacteroidetes bacterium CG18_big_fil_WC_8_21_14_2_50_41_14]